MQSKVPTNSAQIKENVKIKRVEDQIRRKDDFDKMKETLEKSNKEHQFERGEIRNEVDKRTPDFSRVNKKDAFDFGSSSYVLTHFHKTIKNLIFTIDLVNQKRSSLMT